MDDDTYSDPHPSEPEPEVRANPSSTPPLSSIIEQRLSRRTLLKGFSLAAVGYWSPNAAGARSSAASSLTFDEISRGLDDRVHVPRGYRANVLLGWGDSVLPGAPSFDVRNQSARAQSQQFGYNCDYVAFLPLPRGSRASDHGLLCVNHEYTWAGLMFPPGLPADLSQRVAIEMAAHGHSVVEIRREGKDRWRAVPNAERNRRITGTAPMIRVSGPAAGHPRMQTRTDPRGSQVAGTLNNCSGGVTPWGTVLICEENFQYYFGGRPPAKERARLKRYGVSSSGLFPWYRVDDRFNLRQEPNEPNRFGWVVEFDPYDPESVPVKRTALGRLAHEGAWVTTNHDGRIVVYTGDDAPFEYIYKFVSRDPYDPEDPARNVDLLDRGTLYVARFESNGGVKWLPLQFNQGPLTPANGFRDAGEVMIDARRAADLLQATPMDRPEGIATNPVTGRVYVMLTKNSDRAAGNRDAANPRGHNRWGHILELLPPRASGDEVDHAATTGRWEVFILAGNPAARDQGARYHPDVSRDGWFTTPDNCTFDSAGRLWIATDGVAGHGSADGLWACDTAGPGRALTRHFLRGPVGAEITGPCFTPDNRTLFVSIQHPGQGSSFVQPSSRWPDFDPGLPPRPAVVAITKDDGGAIGS